MGVVGGIAINTAHELGHKRADLERWLSKVALAQTGYGHFFIEHNRGHHVRVATPEDPASSRLGESFWAFLPRTVSGSLSSAWGIERARLDRMGKSHWTLHNDILQAWAMTVVLFAVLAVVFGPVVLPYLLLQAVLGFSLLEVVNYLEHYGLLRQKNEDGRYERCLPEHSWNSNNVASNVLLYHLQRHSDHHANPTRRYQALRHVDEAPQLPTGYAGMIVLAWFPPLWRRVMDPRLLDHYDGDLTRANIQPRARRRVLARYGSDRRVSAFRCPGCGYVYDEDAGHPREGFPAGTPWSEVPDDWHCPDCGVRDKVDFEPVGGGRRVTASAATIAAVAEARTPYPQAARQLLRETLFGAARDELQQRAWSEITMAEIAGAAGVSRQTLYKEFGSRDEFAQAFVIHEGERFLDARRRGRARAPRRSPRRGRRRARDLPAHRRRGPAGPHPAQRRRHRRHAALRHHPGHAGRPVGDRPPHRDDRRGLAAGAAAESPPPRRVPGPPRDQLRHRPRRLTREDRHPDRRAARPVHRRGAGLTPATSLEFAGAPR